MPSWLDSWLAAKPTGGADSEGYVPAAAQALIAAQSHHQSVVGAAASGPSGQEQAQDHGCRLMDAAGERIRMRWSSITEELASASKAGDQRAFEALFTRYYAPLVRYVERLTGSRFQSEDLVQEVFARFLRQRSYRPDRPFRPWLFAVTTNTVRDQLRRGSRLPHLKPSRPTSRPILRLLAAALLTAPRLPLREVASGNLFLSPLCSSYFLVL